jgi:hypothetical protein
MDRQSRTHVAQERPPFSTINRHSYANNEDRTAASATSATVPAAPCWCLVVPHVARAGQSVVMRFSPILHSINNKHHRLPPPFEPSEGLGSRVRWQRRW